MNQRSICSQCDGLDVASFADRKSNIPETGVSVVLNLGKSEESRSCTICQFFLRLSPSYRQNYTIHVRLFDRLGQPMRHLTAKLATLDRTPFFSAVRQNSSLRYGYAMRKEITEQGVVVYVPRAASPNLPPVHPIAPVTIDFQLLASFLSHCEASHGSCKPVEDANKLPYIYVIDCVSSQVVLKQSPGLDYFALSYVWGAQTTSRSENALVKDWPIDAFSFDAAPLTVQDAIRVVRCLKKRYLWVDKYCINQHDFTEQKLMIQSMDTIYENAEATIVAAYGDSDEAGLPGVSRIPRIAQARLILAQGCLLSSCPPISTVLSVSKWATRGWTYQEGMLSRRCLFFTEHQVYFVCREDSRSEAVHSDPKDCFISHLLNSSKLDTELFEPRTSGVEGFCRDRLAFSQRSLGQDSDILNAFRGMLNRSPFVTFWGIPITPRNAKMDPNVGFALGLMWVRTPFWSTEKHSAVKQRSSYTRRPGFPTWSWTSIRGEIFNEGSKQGSIIEAYFNGDDAVSIRSCDPIRFSIYSSNKEVSLLEIMQKQQSKMIAEESPLLVVDGCLIKILRTFSYGQYRYCAAEAPANTRMDLLAQIDLDEDTAPPLPEDESKHVIEDALILLNWQDSQKMEGKTRFVLMLLRWVDASRAERKGIISEYRYEYDASEVAQLPRRRETFILQ